MKRFTKEHMPAMLGASIEYYDIALYGYMAPILIQVFLPHLEKTKAYFFFFIFEFFAHIIQVLGARYYGRMGDVHGRRKAMYWAMLSTSCATFIIGLIPSYQNCGIISTILFYTARAAQSFFLGGEYNGGAIYCLEHETNVKKHGRISGFYCAFTVAGIVCASTVATIVHHLGAEYFRLAYGVSFVLAICTYQLRKNIKETSEFLTNKNNENPLPLPLKVMRQHALMIVIASAFFGVLYGIPTRVFNALLPIAAGINANQLMMINTIFLLLYAFLLIGFGFLSEKYGAYKIMSKAALATGILALPLCLIIDTTSFVAIIFSKGVFVVLIAAFASPFHAWTQSLFPTNARYRLISVSYAIGKCFSTICLASTFLIFEHYQNLMSISFILLSLSLITAWSLYAKHN